MLSIVSSAADQPTSKLLIGSFLNAYNDFAKYFAHSRRWVRDRTLGRIHQQTKWWSQQPRFYNQYAKYRKRTGSGYWCMRTTSARK